MKITVLDAKTLGRPAAGWSVLKEFGEYELYDRTSPEELSDRVRDSEIVLTNKVRFPREILEKLPKLRYIGVLATGYDIIDTAAAREHSVVVTNVPEYGTDSVAESVFALLLELTRHVGDHSASVHAGCWENSPDFCFWDHPLLDLAGKTFGIIGYGRIGKRVAQIAKAFRMKVLVWRHGNGEVDPSCEKVSSIEELFSQSDVVSLHVPMTPETKGLISEKNLSLMKKSAILINTGRGGLVDQEALASALRNGKIAGAALDVLQEEPPRHGTELAKLENCIITPHIAWAGEHARELLFRTVVENLASFLKGNIINAVGDTGKVRP